MRLAIAAAIVLLAAQAGAADFTVGTASVDDGKPTRYDAKNYRGKTSTGRFVDGLRVAHRDLPLGSCIDVWRVRPKPQLINAKIDDRGPCKSATCQRRYPWLLARVIDLKPMLAKRLGCDGSCRVAFRPASCEKRG